MITFVYCCICYLLIVHCQTTKTESKENYYSNDSPPISPVVEVVRYKSGSNVEMECHNPKIHKNNVTWEFKRCESNYKEVCTEEMIYQLNHSQGKWENLDSNRRRKKLKIDNATAEDIGLYRCLYKNSVLKTYMLEISVSANYEGPEILSLSATSNTTILPNMRLVIECRATSIINPEVRWFKECCEQKCEKCGVKYEDHCYCAIPAPNAYLSNKTYVSKLNINARNIDSGTYTCFVISPYGKAYRSITIKVEDPNSQEGSEIALSSLFLIPLLFILVPVIVWLYFRGENRKSTTFKRTTYQLTCSN